MPKLAGIRLSLQTDFCRGGKAMGMQRAIAALAHSSRDCLPLREGNWDSRLLVGQARPEGEIGRQPHNWYGADEPENLGIFESSTGHVVS